MQARGAAEDAAAQRLRTDPGSVVVEGLGQYHRAVFGQQRQARIAGAVRRFGQQDVERDAARAVVGQQRFDQIGQARARPGPGPHFLHAGFVDVDHEDARFRRRGRARADEGVTELFVAEKRHPTRYAPFGPGR